MSPRASQLCSLSLACTLGGCGTSQQDGLEPPGVGYQVVSQEPDPEPVPGVELRLGPADLSVNPGSTGTVEITVSPPGVYDVTLAIVGDANGAFLDRDRVRTNADGEASARLTVRFEATDLAIFATAAGHSAELPIAVGPALGTVVVEPAYVGARPLEFWTVDVLHDGSPCPDAGKYEAPGRIFYPGEPIVFPNVPAARPVQVFVRGHGYMFGCVANRALLPGSSNAVVVQVTDRPLQLSELEMNLELSFDRTPLLEGALGTIKEGMLTTFRGSSSADSDALVVAMAEMYGLRAPDYGSGRFDEEALQWGWSELVAEHLDARVGAGNPLSDSLSVWLTVGATALWDSEGFVFGRLITNSSGTAGSFRLDRLGSVNPDVLGMEPRVDLTFGTVNVDALTATFTLALRPSRMLGELADAAPEIEEFQSVVLALQDRLDCAALTDVLLAHADDPEEPLPKCGSACLGQLCQDGVSLMWNRATQTSGTETPLEVNATGPAEIDTQAKPSGFQGIWAGTAHLIQDAEDIHVGGPFDAEAE
jgi:hypothetical protein